MNKKHVPVTDMTTGQIVDEYLNGEIFYWNDSVLVIGFDQPREEGQAQLGLKLVSIELKKGNITRLVETPWTDQLDGTWENGVWCMCDNNKVVKIAKIEVGLYMPYGDAFGFREATQLPQDLADQLEALTGKTF